MVEHKPGQSDEKSSILEQQDLSRIIENLVEKGVILIDKNLILTQRDYFYLMKALAKLVLILNLMNKCL